MPSVLNVNPVNRRVKDNQDVHNTRNIQHRCTKSDSNTKIEERIMRVLPSRAAPKRESASGTLDGIVINQGSVRNSPAMTTKAPPASHQYQQQAYCRATGEINATAYRSTSSLTEYLMFLIAKNKAASDALGKHGTQPTVSRGSHC